MARDCASLQMDLMNIQQVMKLKLTIFSLLGAEKSNIKLPHSTVLISSRPKVASIVWELFDKCVEVLGFGDDQINEYIQAKYGDDKSFSKYLDDHPQVKHTLHSSPLSYVGVPQGLHS